MLWYAAQQERCDREEISAMTHNKKLLIYIPAFNEEECLGRVIDSIPRNILPFHSVEILAIDDGSSDNTYEIACSKQVHVVRHNCNRGVGAAFQSAYQKALELKADILVGIDADGQFDPSQIKMLVEPILKGKADFCTGNRFHAAERPENMPAIKYYGNGLVNRVISFFCRKRIHDASCGFRAYSRECLLNLDLIGDFTYTHETIMTLLFRGFRLEQIPVDVKYFEGRVSRVANSVVRYGYYAGKIMVKGVRDYKPFWFFGFLGMVSFLAGLALMGFTAVYWFFNGVFTPYKFVGILGLAATFLSVIFFIVALVSDMLSRVRINQEKLLYYAKVNHAERVFEATRGEEIRKAS